MSCPCWVTSDQYQVGARHVARQSSPYYRGLLSVQKQMGELLLSFRMYHLVGLIVGFQLKAAQVATPSASPSAPQVWVSGVESESEGALYYTGCS